MTDALEALRDSALERDVLGSCLVFPELIAALDLSDEDFFSTANRDVWRALVKLAAEGEEIDTIRLRSELADRGRLAAVGEEYLLDLTDTLPLRNPPTERLRKLTRLRSIFAASQRIQAAALEGDLDRTIDALATAHGAALSSSSRGRTKDVQALCMPLIEELLSPRTSKPLIHPGYALLEQQIGSQEPGTTIGILATTNVGKSSFAIGTLVHAAERNVVTGYLSVEDQEPLVRARLLGHLAGVSSRKIVQRRVYGEELNRVTRAVGELERLRHHVQACALPGGTEVDVCAAMSELAARGCKIIAVDYLQKITSSKSYSNRAHEVANTGARITSHAQRLGVVLMLASQCSRPEKQRQNTCPSKHDMKESGDIENMLDVIVGLWREHESDFAKIWARVLKGKSGGVGLSWALQRDTETGRLEEVPGSENMEPPDVGGDWSHRRRAS